MTIFNLRLALTAAVLVTLLLSCSGESLVYPDAKPSRPAGVTDYGWDNWKSLSETDQESVCRALRSMNVLEIQSMQLVLDSGVELPVRPPETTDTKDLRILCGVSVPDYRAMQAAAEGQRAEAQEREFVALYRQLTPDSRVQMCGQFKDAGDGRFSYNPDAVNRVLASNGLVLASSKDNFKQLEATCRTYASERQYEEVRYVIRSKLSVMGSKQYLYDRYKPSAPRQEIRSYTSLSISESVIDEQWRIYCGR